MNNYSKMGCKMSFKVYAFGFYLDDFKENMRAYS